MRLTLQSFFYTCTCSSLVWLHRTFYLRRTIILFCTNKSKKNTHKKKEKKSAECAECTARYIMNSCHLTLIKSWTVHLLDF